MDCESDSDKKWSNDSVQKELTHLRTSICIYDDDDDDDVVRKQ